MSIKGMLDRLRGRQPDDKVTTAYVRQGGLFNNQIFPALPTDQLLQRVAGDVYSCVSISASSVGEAAIPELFVNKSSKDQKFTRKTVPLSAKQKSSLIKRHTPYVTDVDMAEKVLEHPLLDMLRTINPLWNRFDFFETWSMHVDTARFYAYIVKDTNGMPIELWPLPPGPMRPVLSRTKLIDHWVYGFGGGATVRFEVDEILYDKRVGPMRSELDAIMGFPPLQGGFAAADASKRLTDHISQLMSNRAVPDLLVTVKGANDPKIKRVKAIVKDWSDGNSGTNAVIGEEVEVEQLGWKPRELEMEKTLKALREHIANVFHVPIAVLTADAVGRANAEAGIYMMAKNNTLPRIRRMEEVINQQLVPMYEPNGSLFLTFRDPVPEDREQARQENVEYVGAGIITQNEARESLGYEPHSDPKASELRQPPDPSEVQQNGSGSSGGNNE